MMAPPEDGEWWCERFAGDGAVLAIRHDVLERRFAELFKTIASARPNVRSAILTFAQYWNDNADDEVHVRAFASEQRAPDWPHRCPDGEPIEAPSKTFCRYCSGDAIPYLKWGYGELVPAFEAYCHERGTQGNDDADNYRPFALARRDGDRIEVEMIGRLVRPWLDMPRDLPAPVPLDPVARALMDHGDTHVLADYWLDKGDVRGEYLALALHSDPTEEMREQALQLWIEHHRAWMGSAAPFVPRGGARFERGFLAEAQLFITEDQIGTFDPDDPVFRTCERIRFLHGSQRMIGRGMQRARVLGPLDDAALEDLVTRPEIFDVEELELEVTDEKTI